MLLLLQEKEVSGTCSEPAPMQVALRILRPHPRRLPLPRRTFDQSWPIHSPTACLPSQQGCQRPAGPFGVTAMIRPPSEKDYRGGTSMKRNWPKMSCALQMLATSCALRTMLENCENLEFGLKRAGEKRFVPAEPPSHKIHH